jgi:redox-sensitive bicupin YhaK (pirin superfamily)
MAKIAIVRSDRLFVSEPDPRMFGNPTNPRDWTSKKWSNENWLKSRFHFSFAEYSRGPSNFGVLRVMNDDLVQADRGFGTHPHRDMEILTFMVRGALTHKDSMGTEETLGRGAIQFMTAGTGIRHEEHNLDKQNDLRFVQCWVVPRRRGLPPNYGSTPSSESAAAERRDKWAHLASDAESPVQTPVKIQQDCNVYVTELTPGTVSAPFTLESSRQAYMLCVEGEVAISEHEQVRQHDGVELRGPLSLELKAGSIGSMILLFEMARTGDGRRDAQVIAQQDLM